MAGDFIGIDIQGLDELRRKLAQWPEQARAAASDAVATYIIDILQTEQPTPKYVTRERAYGQTFFSARQRGWFFASLNENRIQVPYQRTQALRKGWKKLGEGENVIIVNETEGAEYVVGEQQSRHEALVGWKTVDAILDERENRIEEKAYGAVVKVTKKLGLE